MLFSNFNPNSLPFSDHAWGLPPTQPALPFKPADQLEYLKQQQAAEFNRQQVRVAMELIGQLRFAGGGLFGSDLSQERKLDEHEAAAYRVALRTITDYLEQRR